MVNIAFLLGGVALGSLVVIAIDSTIELKKRRKEYEEWKEMRFNEVNALLDDRLEKVNKLYQEVAEMNKRCRDEIMDDICDRTILTLEELFKWKENNKNEEGYR